MKRVLLPLLLVGVVIGSVSVTEAQAPWTSVGSAGTVDEASVAVFDATGAQVRVAAAAPMPATVVVRYNVVALPALVAAEMITMTARFKDTGMGARVVVTLKRVSFATGVTTTMMTIDSNFFAPSADFQTQTDEDCFQTFNFNASAYFIEATITKSLETAAPALQAVQVGATVCEPQ